jgi:hypothetical protein
VKKKKKTKLAWKLIVVAVANFDECVCGNCKINCFKFENHWLLQLNPIYVSTYAYSAIIERALLQGHWTDRYGKEHRV